MQTTVIITVKEKHTITDPEFEPSAMDVNTFVQLFVINRFVKSKKEHETQLLTFATENDTSKTIVSRLLKSGLSWIKDTSFNDNQCNAIFELFNFIMHKNPATYEDIISTKIDSNKYPFCNKVFNQSDIIRSIFQYLRIQDINNCSLVDIGFLYHSFDCNTVFYVHTNDDHLYSIDKSRVWQRFLNARKVAFNELTDHKDEICAAPDMFWQNFCLMKNMEEIKIFLNTNSGAVLRLVKMISQETVVNRLQVFEGCVLFADDNYNMNTSKSKIHIRSKKEYSDVESVPANVFAGIDLLLLNCQHIFVADSLFGIVISKKCHTLSLCSQCNVNYDYKSSDGDDEIKCDMSGIGDLSLINTTFYRKENINNNKNDNGEELKLVMVDDEGIISMAKQCVKVENFKVGKPTSHSLLFWKTLQLNINEIKKQDDHGNNINCKQKDLVIFFDPIIYSDVEMNNMVDYILKNNLWMNNLTINTTSGYQIESLNGLMKKQLKLFKDKLQVFVLDAKCFRGGITSVAECDQLWDFWGINKNGSHVSLTSASDDDKEKLWYEELNVLKWLGFISRDQFLDMKLLNGILAVGEGLNENLKNNGNVIGIQISMRILSESIANFKSMKKLLSKIKKLMIARIPLMINITFEPDSNRSVPRFYGRRSVKKFKNVYRKLFLPKFVFDHNTDTDTDTDTIHNVTQMKLQENEKETKQQEEHDNSGGVPNWYEKPLWDDDNHFYQTRTEPIIALKINTIEFTKIELDKLESVEKVQFIIKTVDVK